MLKIGAISIGETDDLIKLQEQAKLQLEKRILSRSQYIASIKDMLAAEKSIK